MGMQAGACLEPKGRLRGCREAGSVGRPLPLLPGQDGQVSTTALPAPTGSQSCPLHQRFPAERPGERGARLIGGGRTRGPVGDLLDQRGEENLGRPDSNLRPQHRLTLPGPAGDSSSATTPETGLGRWRPLAPQTSGCSGRFGGSADSVVPSCSPTQEAGDPAGPGSLGTDRARSGRGGIR